MSSSIDFGLNGEWKYYLTAELPGMKKEDISISIEDGYIIVSGKKRPKEEDCDRYYLKESRCGSFSRGFWLTENVDEDKVDATFKDGVLTVVIPHEKGAETKKIDIH